MSQDPVVIVKSARTPMGSFQGVFSSVSTSELGAAAIQAVVKDTALAPQDIDEVLMGCVLPAGLGQAPARQAALGAGLDLSTGCTTLNKMCGSGMKAVMQAHDSLIAGSADILIAGGMESMSNAPYILPKARAGLRMGHAQMSDHMFLDGLEDAYEKGRLMGSFAEDTAQEYGFSRTAQDHFAITSLEKAQHASNSGLFVDEITPVLVKTRKSESLIEKDEQPFTVDPAKIPQLRPAFKKEGSVTAGSSSSISDGAAALLLMRHSVAQAKGLIPLAKITAHATHAQHPSLFTTAPVKAIEKVLLKSGWDKSDVDLFEINEAFAIVTMCAIQDLALSPEKVNIYGGACALGHPIGASGARIIVTLLNALHQTKGKKGIASLCIGGGEATALSLELYS